ncbi:hypothetical protein GYA25_01285 [Candidatus Woesearchaeota archaeon]|jgi:hypothetical protein|nr:hypothetical protein [Candidatus Woesearchaeota archaeon]
MLEKTCLNRFLARCKNCSEDYDITHHPNNYDCPFYKEIKLSVYKIKQPEKDESNEDYIFKNNYLKKE